MIDSFELTAPERHVPAEPGFESVAFGESPYRIPDDGIERVINFSGGRSSGYMLYQIIQAHGGRLPSNVRAIFANTGKEREETLRFVRRVEEHFKVPVEWLEYRFKHEAAGGIKDPKHVHEVVGFDSASRAGEPFEQLIETKKLLPNPVKRFCTSELKVRTVERYMRRDLGIVKFRSILGIRHDEPRRWHKALLEECLSDYPMVLDEVDKERVQRFWKQMPFDLEIPSWMGNCDLCFLKGDANKIATIQRDPKVADWWEIMETRVTKHPREPLRKPEMAWFDKRRPVSKLKKMAQAFLNLPLEVIEERAGNEPGIDCFCGD